MKFISRMLLFGLLCSITFYSCRKEAKESARFQAKSISQEIKNKITALGFTATGAIKIEEGYLVEGDIILPEADLNSVPVNRFLVVGNEEQYRTNNLVSGLPRNITVRVASGLPTSYTTATDAAIARYNARGLRITFSRVSSGGSILITDAPVNANYLASSGFPSNNGNPYTKVLVNRSYLDTWNANTVTTILCHEIGHAIGFRHTDYMNRAYSCGGSTVNEGASNVGAVHIPGTPTGPSSGSWMLACISNGVNRNFTSSDATALDYLY